MGENILLPEDIDRKEFTVSFRGYNTEEVDRFLHEIKDALAAGDVEREVLRRKVSAAELLAKDAKNHEEEYLQSISADKEAAERTLADAKAEGERIIREARNAAAGIMAEVRRRAGEMSSECKKDTDALLASARAEAEGTVAKAKSEADKALYSAKIEAENIISTANTERRSIISDAEAKSGTMLAAAKAGAEDILNEARLRRDSELRDVIELRDSATEYAKTVKDACSAICRELEAELQNSASRITLVRRRAENREIASTPDALAHAEEHANPPSDADTAPAAKHAVSDNTSSFRRESDDAQSAPAPANADTGSFHDGYFSEEYKKVMTELFGSDGAHTENADAAPAHTVQAEDDDTYDFVGTAVDDDDTYSSDSDFVDGIEATDDSVTSVFDGTVNTGTPSDGTHTDQMVDSVYKSFDDDDINDILSGL